VATGVFSEVADQKLNATGTRRNWNPAQLKKEKPPGHRRLVFSGL
jgi:hypothetical protein